MLRTTNKNCNRVIKELIKEGWIASKSHSGHIKMKCPTGGFVSISVTPRTDANYKEVIKDIRRLQPDFKL